eukprot:1142152-Pelagomonas_calceolata.AAC.2
MSAATGLQSQIDQAQGMSGQHLTSSTGAGTQCRYPLALASTYFGAQKKEEKSLCRLKGRVH